MSVLWDKDPDDWTDSDWRIARNEMARDPAPSGAGEWTDEEIVEFSRRAQRVAAEKRRLDQEMAEHEQKRAENQRVRAEVDRELAEAQRNLRAIEAENARRDASIGLLADITGCRLVAGADGMRGPIGNVTVQFSDPEAVRILVRDASHSLLWGGIESIAVEALPERSRVTASRAVGFGLLSLAARKRTAWCVMTIVCGQRHFVLEVPREAHRLHGELATAGVWRLT